MCLLSKFLINDHSICIYNTEAVCQKGHRFVLFWTLLVIAKLINPVNCCFCSVVIQYFHRLSRFLIHLIATMHCWNQDHHFLRVCDTTPCRFLNSNKLESTSWHIPKANALVISGLLFSKTSQKSELPSQEIISNCGACKPIFGSHVESKVVQRLTKYCEKMLYCPNSLSDSHSVWTVINTPVTVTHKRQFQFVFSGLFGIYWWKKHIPHGQMFVSMHIGTHSIMFPTVFTEPSFSDLSGF